MQVGNATYRLPTSMPPVPHAYATFPRTCAVCHTVLSWRPLCDPSGSTLVQHFSHLAWLSHNTMRYKKARGFVCATWLHSVIATCCMHCSSTFARQFNRRPAFHAYLSQMVDVSSRLRHAIDVMTEARSLLAAKCALKSLNMA